MAYYLQVFMYSLLEISELGELHCLDNPGLKLSIQKLQMRVMRAFWGLYVLMKRTRTSALAVDNNPRRIWY